MQKKESDLSPEHGSELLADPLKDLLDGGGVADKGGGHLDNKLHDMEILCEEYMYIQGVQKIVLATSLPMIDNSQQTGVKCTLVQQQ